MRLTTGRLFWIAFAVGAAAFPLAYVIWTDIPVILMAMSMPGVLLTVHLVFTMAIRFGAEWLALPLVSGANGLVYGAVVVAIWKVYQALRRKRDTRP